MTSQGSAHGRFPRAIKRRNLLAAETAARELGSLSLADALALCLLYEAEGDTRLERAFRPWLSRVPKQHALSHEEVELLRAAAGALRSSFREIGLATLEHTREQLGLPRPTLPMARENSPPAAGKPMRSV